jgi:hypothetical protein
MKLTDYLITADDAIIQEMSMMLYDGTIVRIGQDKHNRVYVSAFDKVRRITPNSLELLEDNTDENNI